MLPRIVSPSKAWGADTDAFNGHCSESALSETTPVDKSPQRTKDLNRRPRSASTVSHDNPRSNAEHCSDHLPVHSGVLARITSPMIIRNSGQNEFGSRAEPSPPTRKHIFQLPRRKQRQRCKPRRRQRTERVNGLFTSFTLNRDPENSKYLPYNEVIYPKLFNRPTSWRSMVPTQGEGRGGNGVLCLDAAAELNSMWMVGFVDDAWRHQKETLLRELRDFIRLPGSTVLPNSRSTLDTISHMETATSFNSLTTSASSRHESFSAREPRPVASAGKEMPMGVEDIDRFEDGAEGSGSSEGGKSALTPLERLRLRELERKLSQASLGISDRDADRRAGIRAYTAANHKLRKILSGARPPAVGPSLKSEGLEAVIRRNREELSATICIQRPYKLYLRRKKFGLIIRQLRGVVRVQALVRGVIARKYFDQWYSRRSSTALAWQMIIRRALSNIRRRKRLVVENWTATRLQAVARGRAGRDKAKNKRANLAALRIQCLWRGSVDRARTDRLWLNTLATRVQGLARVMSARRAVEHRRRIYNDASRTIQRCFRGTVARSKMARMIWERGMNQRLDFLRAVAAEEDWDRESMEEIQMRWRRTRLEERLEEALAAESATHAAVFDLESNEQELQTQRLMLSPRDLQQGWKEELNDNIEQHRDWITKRKLEAVFGASLTARKLEEEVKRRDELLAESKHRLTQLARWRDVEMRGILDREARRRFDEQHFAERRKIAEEKRKWAVSHVTLSGKPDKMKTRRRSRPWEAFEDPIEGVLKQVFTGGSVDLFANERSPEEALKDAEANWGQREMLITGWSGGGRVEKEGTNLSKSGSLEQVAARLKLQAYVNQVAQLDEIMQPAQEVVSTFDLKPLFKRARVRRECDEGAAANSPREISSTSKRFPSSSPHQRAPIDVSVLTPSLDGGRANEDNKNAASAIEGEGVPERRVDLVEFSPPDSRDRPGSPQTIHGYKGAELASARRLIDRYGAAASTPPGRPPAVGTGGTSVPIEWGEEETVRARQRQRRLHMLATTMTQEGKTTTTSKLSSAGSCSRISHEEGGWGEGESRWVSRVPWQLLDELEAEKRKLRLCKIWSGDVR